MKTPLSLLILLAMTLPLSGSPSEPFIADYKDNKAAAFSFTFDDGFRAEVQDTMEVIEPLGIRGTFFIIPPLMAGPERRHNTINWDEARDLSARGQELGTHGTIRRKLHEIDDATLDQEINGGWESIRDEIGAAPTVYAAPGGSRVGDRESAKILERHIAYRNRNLPRIQIQGYGNAGRRVWEDQATRDKIETAIENGRWFVPTVHSIVGGYSPLPSKEVFREHCEWIANQSDRLWIAPFGEVAAYVLQREATELEVVESRQNGYRLRLVQTNENTTRLRCPLDRRDSCSQCPDSRCQD